MRLQIWASTAAYSLEEYVSEGGRAQGKFASGLLSEVNNTITPAERISAENAAMINKPKTKQQNKSLKWLWGLASRMVKNMTNFQQWIVRNHRFRNSAQRWLGQLPWLRARKGSVTHTVVCKHIVCVNVPHLVSKVHLVSHTNVLLLRNSRLRFAFVARQLDYRNQPLPHFSTLCQLVA